MEIERGTNEFEELKKKIQHIRETRGQVLEVKKPKPTKEPRKTVRKKKVEVSEVDQRQLSIADLIPE